MYYNIHCIGTLGACGMSLRFSNSRALENRTFSLKKKYPHNFGMESLMKKLKRSLESDLEWLSNDVLISKVIKCTSKQRT